MLSVTLNRPDSLNSLTQDMLVAIADAMDLAGTDPDVRVVRLGGRGPRVLVRRGHQRGRPERQEPRTPKACSTRPTAPSRPS